MANSTRTSVPPLPGSSDDLWEGAEQMKYDPVPVKICGKGEHQFIANGNAAECVRCPYGTLLPGYMRVSMGKLVDLRDRIEG